MRIALFQTHIIWEDKEANFAKLEAQLKAIHSQQVDLILLPEMSFTGFSMNTSHTAEKSGETIQRMQELARAYQIAIGFGWVKSCGEPDGCAEKQALAENHYTVVAKDGAVLSDYAKIHPFSYSGEDLKFKGGDKLTVFELCGVPFSGFICYDLRFPEIFQAVSKIAHVIMVPADWPAKRSEHWKALLRARAIENQVYILAVNCVGQIDTLYYSGDSCVINPDGQVMDMLSDKEGVLIYDLQDDAEQYRSQFPVKKDRREELYREWMEYRK